MRAASASSIGMVRKYWRSRKQPKAPPRKLGRYRGAWVPYRPRALKITNCGIAAICAGIISVTSRATNSTCRPGKRTTAKTKAPIEQVSSCPTVEMAATFRLFHSRPSKGRIRHSVA
jgi:hypothetical protein